MSIQPNPHPEACIQATYEIRQKLQNPEYKSAEEASHIAIAIGEVHLAQHALEDNRCASSEFTRLFAETAQTLKRYEVASHYLNVAKRLRRREQLIGIIMSFAAQYSLDQSPLNLAALFRRHQ